jgi:hypothetical protein
MKHIQARRRRRIVGPTLGDRARPVGNDPARLSLEPERLDVCGWENEGGAGRSDLDGRALEAPGAASRVARQG